MKIAFHEPTIVNALLFGKALGVVVAAMYGVRIVIAGGTVMREPELFREIVLLMFSVVLPFKLCRMLCWHGNDMATRCTMFLVFYIPMGFAREAVRRSVRPKAL